MKSKEWTAGPDYQLAKLNVVTSDDIAVTAKSLKRWLDQLPLLNVNDLAYDIAKYMQALNQYKVSDKQRFKMLELLRPIVAHIFDALTKQFRSSSLDLSIEFQEMQWLLNVLLKEMAVGYQRLLSHICSKRLNWLSRSQYEILSQRVSYYLGEQIRIAYILSSDVADNVWHDLHLTYRFCQDLDLDNILIKDEIAFYNLGSGSVDIIYKRCLLLAMVEPYSLRSRELEQIYFGLTSWLDELTLELNTNADRSGYSVDFDKDSGPDYYSTIKLQQTYIDNSRLVKKLSSWLRVGTAPESSNSKGMSKQLLKEVIAKLDGSKQRALARKKLKNGSEVQVVIGLHDIDVFLSQRDGNDSQINGTSNQSLLDNHHSSEQNIADIWQKFSVKQGGDPVIDSNHQWQKDSTDVWDQLHYYMPTAAAEKEIVIAEPEQKTAIKHISFMIENESEKGMSLSCNYLQGSGLFIGELMYIKSYKTEIWTLGIIRWMKINDKKLTIGLYILSAQVDRVLVQKFNSKANMKHNALWLSQAQDKQFDTLLLPKAEFKSGDILYIKHQGRDLNVRISKSIWNSEVFSQFRFNDMDSDKSTKIDSIKQQDYLIPDWAR